MPRDNQQEQPEIVKEIITTIQNSKEGFKSYPIRHMINHAEKFGEFLEKQHLKTNQIRKFLDAVNQIKAEFTQDAVFSQDVAFSKIEVDVVLLKPKLAYASARQSSVKELSNVLSIAIDHVHDPEDFDRFVQFLEATIAYHRAAGGKQS